MANVLTPREVCRLGRHGFDTDTASDGDVLRCEHGGYWMFHWYPWNLRLNGQRGYWFKLSWFDHPVWLWRARRVLRSE